MTDIDARLDELLAELKHRPTYLAYGEPKDMGNSQLLAAALAASQARAAELERLVYVPGVWRCAKCKLNLVSTEMHATTGAFRANNSPQECPNGCGPLWRKTEREAGNELVDRLDGLTDRATAAEAEIARLWEARDAAQIWINLFALHPPSCGSKRGDDCDCGLVSVMDKLAHSRAALAPPVATAQGEV